MTTVVKVVCEICRKHLDPDNVILCNDCLIDHGGSPTLCGQTSCIDEHERRVPHPHQVD